MSTVCFDSWSTECFTKVQNGGEVRDVYWFASEVYGGMDRRQ